MLTIFEISNQNYNLYIYHGLLVFLQLQIHKINFKSRKVLFFPIKILIILYLLLNI